MLGSRSENADNLRFEVAIYDTEARTQSATPQTASFASGTPPPDSLIRSLADALVSGPRWRGDGAAGPAGTSSVRARRSFGTAVEQMDAWDLRGAGAAFSAALEADPQFVLANLRLAETMNWLGEPVGRWENEVALADASSESLTDLDRMRATGLIHLAAGRYQEACDTYAMIVSATRMSSSSQTAFSGWYGNGECRRSDPIVVQDMSSSTGWRFRSNKTDAAEAYRTAFVMVPGSHRVFREDEMVRIREMLLAQGHRVRFGRTATGGDERFIGIATLDDDTLAYRPHRWDPVEGTTSPPDLVLVEAARIRQREVVRSIADRWATAYPDSPDAAYSVGIALEMLGDATAADAFRRANSLGQDDAKKREAMAAEVWVLVKHGLPADGSYQSDQVARAHALADSLLSTTDPEQAANPRAMASLAALLGRPSEAADYAERAIPTRGRVTDAPERLEVRLTLAAASGADSIELRRLEGQLWEYIEANYVAEERDNVLPQYVERAAFLAFPEHRSRLPRRGQSSSAVSHRECPSGLASGGRR